jgi:Bacterial regulatory proteins, tetR family
MVQAAKQLIREGGYGATAFSDVLTLSGAPRGSVYFHFPAARRSWGWKRPRRTPTSRSRLSTAPPSPAPYDSVRAVLVSHAAIVSSKTASRTRS